MRAILEPFKECPKCGVSKAVSAFGKNRSNNDGLAYYCKACFLEISKASYRRRAMAAGRTVRERPERGPEGTKWCPDCGFHKRHEELSVNPGKSDGRASYCKAHQQARIEISRKKLHGSARHYHLVHRYGIGAEQVEELIQGQAGLCVICQRQLGDKPHVDHDHATGQVRGILCFNCNGGLGQFGDDIDRLQQAIEYLRGNLQPSAQAAAEAEQRLRDLINHLGRAA